ncbi:immunoglobulin superfamily member 1-like [Emys orbicularis]|uniref:immunoglobulin superfamily member 1-like n=1 Tax=Emys orbicularis TaxID=82168 RepID=UPI0031FDC30E
MDERWAKRACQGALLRKFELTPETYRKRFQGVRKTSGVSYKEVTNLLGEYLCKWGKGTGATTTEDAYNLVGLEQLYDICPPDLKMWLVDRKPKDLRSAGAVADEFADKLPAPGPSISVSPRGVIAPGQAITIRCQCPCEARRLFMYKDGIKIREVEAAGDGGEFTIPSTRWEDSGSYSCRSRSRLEPPNRSDPSDYVRIVVAEPSYPKPIISLRPSGGVSLGGAVSVWCRGQRRGVRFVLNKEGRHFPPVDSDDIEAVFPISNVSREDGGSYSCSYHSRSEPLAVSYPSDPMELVLRDPSLPRPSITLSPTGVTAPGADATIRCQGQRRNVTFFLHKAGDLNPQRHVDPAGDGAEFRIPTMGRQHGGNYSCSYRPQSEPFISSYPSSYVELVVAEPSYPKPNISLSPSGGVSLGGAVTVWCRGQHRGMRFVLNKEGRHFPPVDSDGFEAVFPISNVSREDGGSYSCSYHSRSEPFTVLYPSDPVELVVRGADATIPCQGQRRDVRFFLHKAGDLNPQQHVDPAGDRAEFHIPTVSRQHGGNYSCSYRPRSEPFVSSEPSNPVQLVVAAAPPDFTNTNIARLGLGATVLLVLGLILAEAYYSRPRGAP